MLFIETNLTIQSQKTIKVINILYKSKLHSTKKNFFLNYADDLIICVILEFRCCCFKYYFLCEYMFLTF